jgi:hypothetical protein
MQCRNPQQQIRIRAARQPLRSLRGCTYAGVVANKVQQIGNDLGDAAYAMDARGERLVEKRDLTD